MGLLALGHPYLWHESEKPRAYVKEHGITQFLNLYNREKTREEDPFLWGDEVEANLVRINNEAKNVTLNLDTAHIFAEANAPDQPKILPEYGRYMIESTPAAPRTSSGSDLLSVSHEMFARRRRIESRIRPDETIVYFASFPRLGATTDSSYPFTENQDALTFHGPVAKSLFVPDEITNPHVRFPTLTKNIRARRGSKVAINVPLYKDVHTQSVDPTTPWDSNRWSEDAEAKNGAALKDHIYMDAMGFGMGCSCLQMTYQAANINDARDLADAFVPVAPIMLAVSGASPIFRGFLADVDARWDVISAAVDDRTKEERSGILPKSRYDSISLYIADRDDARQNNDIKAPIHDPTYKRLLDNGVDEALARHVAHLFVRDPLVIFDDYEDKDDTKSSDHFENIQSTNWQTVRFKPPTLDSTTLGWRVEFRPLEIQITDIENSAFAVFVTLLARAIPRFRLNLYMPISKVDENMARSQRRDPVHTQKFFFPDSFAQDHSLAEFSLADIVSRLAHYVYQVIDADYDQHQRSVLRDYTDFVVARASGRLKTWATYMRDFVLAHPAYKKDSVVSHEILYDLTLQISKLESAQIRDDSLLPSWYPEARLQL